MNLIAFTDFHGNQDAYRRAKTLIVNEKPELVIVAGDVTNYDTESAKISLSQLGDAGRPIYFVPGNMDNPDLGSWPGNDKVHALHGRCEYRENIAIVGLGGSPHGPFSTPFEFSEEEAVRLLDGAMKSYRGGKIILVAHCPPKDTKIDRTVSGVHAGSSSVRKFVEKNQPIVVISGHIHEAQGTDAIGPCVIVNTGPAQRGHYAQINVDDRTSVNFGRLF